MRWGWIALVAALRVGADDGYHAGVRGSPAVMSEHPTVSMLAERVDVWLPERRVEAQFVFRNHGPDTTVRMAFPEEAYIDGTLDGRADSQLDYFRTWVDGVRVPTSIERDPSSGGQFRLLWHTKRVHFRRGQTRTVVDHYRGGKQGTSDGRRHFNYILWTGGSWHGPIGYARVVCHVDPSVGWPWMLSRTAPAHWQTADGSTIVFEFSDLEPSRQDQGEITLSWMPGFSRVWVNGEPVHPWNRHPDLSTQQADDGVDTCLRRGHDMDVGLRLASAWLEARFGATHLATPWRCRIRRGGHTVELSEGSDRMRVDGATWRLPTPIGNYQGRLTGRLGPIVEALGGTICWSEERRGLIVELPERL